ncbi:radical SAM/SPASM domain-containing protein [Lentzea nigeriaca]|uniref:radical SAM/SPASM domain-containing protein n=1 Tax=Lentzea nigeriaca TaxID=1128665 RepID=UPI0019561497|nr:radical SAM/SPASM domain-containing protein [Lentzea nigeriaca]MBM7861975.1 MoaA/NifB/PqqE/SkfB family radical SAM enzyme [Lentzea nigeriaca]
MTDLRFAWLEITGKCQLSCTHCYADSGPRGTHGAMRTRDWSRAISQLAELGVQSVQFIGGEPTLHPDLPSLVDHTLDAGLSVEIFTNLVDIGPRLWDTFSRPGVRLATSYYSDTASQHDAVTRRRGSHARTQANIVEARTRDIPLRAGVIDVSSSTFIGQQRTRAARDELSRLGVSHVGSDRLRGVGRGAASSPSPDELCGRCGHGAVAISATGEVWPCVFARWISLGNILDTDLSVILSKVAAATPASGSSCWPQGGGSCAPNDPPRA